MSHKNISIYVIVICNEGIRPVVYLNVDISLTGTGKNIAYEYIKFHKV